MLLLNRHLELPLLSLAFATLYLLYAPPCIGIAITNLQVPIAIRNGTELGALLDCEYNVTPEEREAGAEAGLVVKWFLNNDSSQVYQWIPGQPPQALGVLKGRLQLDYKASEDPLMMHRAIFIEQPTVELQGLYKCCVSTFDDEDNQQQNMIVFSPGDGVRMHTESDSETYVNIACSVKNVFPEPLLDIYIAPGFQAEPSKRERVIIPGPTIIARGSEYDILLETSIKKASFPSEDSLTIWCELIIPEADNFTLNSITSLRVPRFALGKPAGHSAGRTISSNFMFTIVMSIIFQISELYLL